MQYDIVVTVTGTGTGTVTSSPGTINCPENCVSMYDPNTVVTLTATPTGDSTFAGWGGDCSSFGTNPVCQITVTYWMGATATFNAPGGGTTYPLNVIVAGNGEVTGSGIACGNAGSICMQDIPAGTSVTLTATEGAMASFAGWSGCTSVNGNDCVINLTSDKTVTATCNLASLMDNEVLRGTTYYDTIAQAIGDTSNSATVIKAVAAPTKAIQPVTCTTAQSVKLEGMYTSKQFLTRSTTLTPVGSVTISGGCSIEFDGITIQ
jgi:hypothetical protein